MLNMGLFFAFQCCKNSGHHVMIMRCVCFLQYIQIHPILNPATYIFVATYSNHADHYTKYYKPLLYLTNNRLERIEFFCRVLYIVHHQRRSQVQLAVK